MKFGIFCFSVASEAQAAISGLPLASLLNISIYEKETQREREERESENKQRDK